MDVRRCKRKQACGRTLTPARLCEVQITLPGPEHPTSLLASYHLSHPLLEPEILTLSQPKRLHKSSKQRASVSFDSFSRDQLLSENANLRGKVQLLGKELDKAKRTIAQLQYSVPMSSASTTCSDPHRLVVPLLDVKSLSPCKGFHEEFMENLPNFSQSWRAQIDK